VKNIVNIASKDKEPKEFKYVVASSDIEDVKYLRNGKYLISIRYH
jgi:hypothetical protein